MQNLKNSIPGVAHKLRLSAVLQEISGLLETVDNRLRAQAAAFDPALVGYIEYICESPGKRLRASLALLSGAATGRITSEHIDLGTIVELIHLASLVHDDIMDRAQMRRGRPTPHAKWGPEVSVLLGDALFAHALKLCTNYDSTHLARRIATASTEVCQGEIIQTQRQFDLNLTIDEYCKIIRMKTAALFAVSAELGAFLSNASPEVCEALRSYGESLGIAYQMYDDCLDLIGHDDAAGKTLGTDLEKGKLTLPVLLHLQRVSGTERDSAYAAILHGTFEQRMLLIEELHASGAFRDALKVLREHLVKAGESLRVLNDSSYKKSLTALAALLENSVAEMISDSEYTLETQKTNYANRHKVAG